MGLRGYKLTAELNLGKFWRICYPGVTISQQQKNRPAPLQTLNPGTSGRCLGERAILQRDRSAIRLRGVAVGGISQLALIGDASLKVLRDKRLYRSTHKPFEDYCQERIGITRIRAHQRIAFAGVLEGLLTQVNKLPATEKQARPLSKLPTPELQAEAWETAQAASGTDQPSAAVVSQSVELVNLRRLGMPV